MMKNILGLFILLGCTSQLKAQLVNTVSDNSESQSLYRVYKPINVLTENRYFFDTLYHNGELKTRDSLYTTELKYRFDQLEGTVQVKFENGKELLLKEMEVVYLKMYLKEETVFFIPVSIPGRKKITLMQVIYRSPTLQLLRDSEYSFKPKNNYSTIEVEINYLYYFNKGGRAPFTEVKPNAKSFIKILPDKKELITKLFKNSGNLTLSRLALIVKDLDAP